MDDAAIKRIQNSPEFIALTTTRKSFAWTLAIAILAIYYGFIALVAFAPASIGTVVSGTVTVGLVLGIAVILSAVLLTGIYVWRANGQFDEMTASIVARAKGDGR